jgi:hypothetical protein
MKRKREAHRRKVHGVGELHGGGGSDDEVGVVVVGDEDRYPLAELREEEVVVQLHLHLHLPLPPPV